MTLPAAVEQLCTRYLAQVKQDPQHDLSSLERLDIYKALEPAQIGYQSANVRDKALNWLAIFTVKYALTRWELVKHLDEWETKYIAEVKDILRDAQALLRGTLDFNEAQGKLWSDYWYFTHFFVKHDLACLNDAAVYTLATIINGQHEDDAVENAEKAYTVIDENEPGAVERDEIIIPLEFDLQKRLEFWEWWLSEAIPQAWKVANKTFK